ncbi:MAG: NAD(+) synthase [Candidatus Helarchaeota archaeon]|nr:NAD(+) synthase [Candidatus Helarchaeota archaeon]
MLIKDFLQIDPVEVSEKIVNFIRQKVETFERDGIIVGLSGGLDSSCVAGLSVKAVGKDNVYGLIMPEKDSSKESAEYAQLLANQIEIKTQVIDHAPILEKWNLYNLLSKQDWEMGKAAFAHKRDIQGESAFTRYMSVQKGIKPRRLRKLFTYMNMKHRIRAATLYYYGERLNYLVIGASNKSEALTGWFVKYGDSATDIMPIRGLYKTQVKALSKYLNLPQQILEREPMPDFFPGLKDTFVFEMNYEQLDSALVGIEKGISSELIIKETGVSISTIESIKKLMKITNHKRSLPEVPTSF